MCESRGGSPGRSSTWEGTEETGRQALPSLPFIVVVLKVEGRQHQVPELSSWLVVLPKGCHMLTHPEPDAQRPDFPAHFDPESLQSWSLARQPHCFVVGLHALAQHMLANAGVQLVPSLRQHLPCSHVMWPAKGG